jgi:hypothetical protein
MKGLSGATSRQEGSTTGAWPLSSAAGCPAKGLAMVINRVVVFSPFAPV